MKKQTIQVGQTVRVVDLNPVVTNRKPAQVGKVVCSCGAEVVVEIGNRTTVLPVSAVRVVE